MSSGTDIAEPPMTQSVPLTRDADGVLRVKGSRVTLASIVHQFQSGATAEQIQEDFPSVALGDIYAVIAWFLQYAAAVGASLAGQKRDAERVRREVELGLDTGSLREQLRRRRARAAA